MSFWRHKTQRAFQFWLIVLEAGHHTPQSHSQYEAIRERIGRFKKGSQDTFKYLIERHADPVYLLLVLITLCDEGRVKHAVGFPQVFTVEKGGTFPDDLGDFQLITETDMHTIETARPALERAGLTHTLAGIVGLRERFDALPPPPRRDGYIGEKAVLHTEFPHPVPAPSPKIGRPGEYYFNTAMMLLDRHLKVTAPEAVRYPSIALLLNAFCPASFQDSRLSKGSVRQRILSTRPHVESYCQFLEDWFVHWKASIQRDPIPFDPWAI